MNLQDQISVLDSSTPSIISTPSQLSIISMPSTPVLRPSLFPMADISPTSFSLSNSIYHSPSSLSNSIFSSSSFSISICTPPPKSTASLALSWDSQKEKEEEELSPSLALSQNQNQQEEEEEEEVISPLLALSQEEVVYRTQAITEEEQDDEKEEQIINEKVTSLSSSPTSTTDTFSETLSTFEFEGKMFQLVYDYDYTPSLRLSDVIESLNLDIVTTKQFRLICLNSCFQCAQPPDEQLYVNEETFRQFLAINHIDKLFEIFVHYSRCIAKLNSNTCI